MSLSANKQSWKVWPLELVTLLTLTLHFLDVSGASLTRRARLLHLVASILQREKYTKVLFAMIIHLTHVAYCCLLLCFAHKSTNGGCPFRSKKNPGPLSLADNTCFDFDALVLFLQVFTKDVPFCILCVDFFSLCCVHFST